MASSIDASTSGAGGVITTADNTGVLQLKTAGTTAVTVDASQNVGIGTTSPTVKLDVNGTSAKLTNNASADVTVTIGPDTATASRSARLGFLASNTYKNWYIGSSWNTSGGLEFTQTTTTGGTTMSSTPSIMIDSSGVVLVGTSSYNTGLTSTCKFQAQNNGGDFCGAFQNSASSAPYGLYVKYTNAAPNSTGSEFLYCADSSTNRFIARSNGGLYNYQANNANISDEREKKDIQLAGNYLDKICAIPVKTFLFNDQTDTDLNLGVIAQDVQAVAPELVVESNWAANDQPEKLRLSIYQTDLQYALMKCIQEQQTIINDLKARVTALEAK